MPPVLVTVHLTVTSVHALVAELGYVGPHCRTPNGHHHCNLEDACACTCHLLDPTKIGWLRPELERTIVTLEPLLGTLTRPDPAWYAAATVLAVWHVGTDPVRIQHAVGTGPTAIAACAERLRAAHVWDEDGSWHARYAERDATDADILELALHVLVAEGRAGTVPQPDGTLTYYAIRAPHPT